MHEYLHHVIYKKVNGVVLSEEEEVEFAEKLEHLSRLKGFVYDEKERTLKGKQMGIQSKDHQLFTLEMGKNFAKPFQ